MGKTYQKGKQFTIEDRMELQAMIHHNMSFSAMGKRLGFSHSSILREIHRNGYTTNGGAYGNTCRLRIQLIVCNRCYKRQQCINYNKFYYNYKKAQEKADTRRVNSRSSPKISVEQIQQIDQFVKQGISLKQSLHHIYVSHPELAKICSERTIRRLIYRGNLSVRPHELRQYVRYKRQYIKPNHSHVKDLKVLLNRTFRDFKRVTTANPDRNIVQYDSLIGKRDDKKALLTIFFPKYSFQFGFLINKDSSRDVVKQVKTLFRKLGSDMVKKIFPLNLSDNGSEFTHFHQIEVDEHGEVLCRVFFTNPYRSTDKAHCERNHALVRYFLPKSKSLNELTQPMIDEMFSHLNSYVRAAKGNSTPYELVLEAFGEEFLNIINIQPIDKRKVRLFPLV